MNKDQLKQIKKVIKKVDDYMKDCHCGYKKVKYSFCEQYGCSTIDELVEPLRKLVKEEKNKPKDPLHRIPTQGEFAGGDQN